MTLTREIEWLTDRLLEEYPRLRDLTAKNHPALTPRDFLKARIIWGIPKGFTYFWADKYGPYGAILIRPVNEELIEKIKHDYWNSICDFDPNGDICWCDYGCGRGLYAKEMVTIFRSTGCSRLGWEHRLRAHVEPMNRIGKVMRTMKTAFHS